MAISQISNLVNANRNGLTAINASLQRSNKLETLSTGQRISTDKAKGISDAFANADQVRVQSELERATQIKTDDRFKIKPIYKAAIEEMMKQNLTNGATVTNATSGLRQGAASTAVAGANTQQVQTTYSQTPQAAASYLKLLG